MNEQIFQETFETHIRNIKFEIAGHPTALLFPKLTIYSEKRYDQTMAQVSIELPTMRYVEQFACAANFGKQMREMDVLGNQPIGAVFLTRRVFYDTDEIKGNQVLQVYALSKEGITGEVMISFGQKADELTTLFDPEITVVFGINQITQEMKLLREFMFGLGFIAPQIVPFGKLLTLPQIITQLSNGRG